MYCVILELEGNPLQYPGSISLIYYIFFFLDSGCRNAITLSAPE